MAMYLTTGRSVPASKARPDRRLKAQARLSGAALSYSAACNPASLSVPSFKRVVDFTDDDAPVRRLRIVKVSEVDDEDIDW
jgi:hypothetical protein